MSIKKIKCVLKEIHNSYIYSTYENKKNDICRRAITIQVRKNHFFHLIYLTFNHVLSKMHQKIGFSFLFLFKRLMTLEN